MKKEKTITYKVKRDVLCCDNCGKMINDVFDKTWLKGAFQTGKNEKGEIGTWCSESCLKDFELKFPNL